MKKLSLITGLLGAISGMTSFATGFNLGTGPSVKPSGTRMRRDRSGASGRKSDYSGCVQSDKGGRFDTFAGKPIPRGYPGAKIARKALFGQLTKRH